MNVLVINAGSSSLKYQVINMADESVIAKGLCEKVGCDDAFCKQWYSDCLLYTSPSPRDRG